MKQTINIPLTATGKIQALLKTKTIVSSAADIDKDVNKFLETIDNVKRVFLGKNLSTIPSNKTDLIVTQIWYLENIPKKPVDNPFKK